MEIEWTLDRICRQIQGKLYGVGQVPVRNLAIDSRNVIPYESTLFVALRGDHHNGHDFIPELYDRGIRAFMVSGLPDLPEFPGAGFCLVENTLDGLQKLASVRRKAFRGKVAAITGSNGKTIVKEWIYQCMSGPFRVFRSPKSYNSQVGVPLSLWLMEEQHDLSVIEAGISCPGEMEKLMRMIAPEVGLFTNLGTAHQQNFSGMEEKLKEKLVLFRDCRKVIFRSAAEYEGLHIEDQLADLGADLIGWTLDRDTGYGSVEPRYRYYGREPEGGGTEISAEVPAGKYTFRLFCMDGASVENALHAFTFALEMGLPVDQAIRRIEALEPVSMRMEMLSGINGCVLVNDTYNSDIGGLSAALDMLNRLDQKKEKIVILSDLLQSGMEEKELYAEIAGLVHGKGIDRFMGIGPSMMLHRAHFQPESRFFPDTDDFLKRMDRTRFRNSNILIKGSRKFGFEKITGELQLRSHQTHLEIDLDAVVHNLNYFRAVLGDEVRIMVMVKALSYGSGSVEIANLLQYHKVDYLAVAFIDEGIELRHAGIHLPLMVMNPDPSAYSQMIDYRLEPEIFNLRGIEALHKVLHYRGISDYPIHIKLDTGMHRLGFAEEEIETLAPILRRKEFRLASVFTHLAASDEPEHDSFSRKQIGTFERAADRLSGFIGYPVDRHVLNSSGIERFPEARFQMVRLGIGLHGIGQGTQLVPVSSYRTRVSQVRVVKEGESVGYSRKGRTGRKSLIATIPVGYADGMDRRLGNGTGTVWINGTTVPTIGNICMDMTMIDVTGLEVSEGDEVELFGKNQLVTEVARQAGTIPYEILTSIPERVKRVYLQE